MTRLAVALLFLAIGAVAQTIDEPLLQSENGTLSIFATKDVVFQLLDNSTGTLSVLSTSVSSLKQSTDTNRATIASVSGTLAAAKGDSSQLSSAIAALGTTTVPALSAATAAVASGAQAANAALGSALDGASTTLASQASRASDLYSITSLLSSALDAAQSYARSVSSAVDATNSAVNDAVSYTDSISTSVVARMDTDVSLATAISSLAQTLGAQVVQVNTTLQMLQDTQTNALSESTAVQASRITGVSTALHTAVNNIDTLSTSIVTRISVDSDLSAAIAAAAVNATAQVTQVSTALRTLVLAQSLQLSDSVATQASRTTSLSAAAQLIANDAVLLSTRIEARVGQDVVLSTAIAALTISAATGTSQLSTALLSLINTQAANLAASTAIQATRITDASTALATTISNLGVVSTGVVNAQTIAGQMSTNVGSQISTVSTATANLAANVYTRATSDTQLSNAIATMSTATATQVSTLSAATSDALAARVLLSAFITNLQLPFNMNSRAPTPTAAGVVLGISGLVMWLDAMNYYSVPGGLNLWADISQSTGSPRFFGWIVPSQNTQSFVMRGAFMFNGNGYFTNSACSFLPLGSASRTILFWARPEQNNVYIRHIFHYGRDNTLQAWGPAMIVNNPLDPTQSGPTIHQWASTITQMGSWVHGEVAFFAITFNGASNPQSYSISKNGAPLAALGTTTGLNTQLNGGNGFCNVGSRVNPGEFFQGAISAVYMFNRVLTNAEISNIYTNTLRWF